MQHCQILVCFRQFVFFSWVVAALWYGLDDGGFNQSFEQVTVVSYITGIMCSKGGLQSQAVI